jgi:hypothetical protein
MGYFGFSVAKRYGAAHEADELLKWVRPSERAKAAMDSRVDQYNNAVARRIGATIKPIPRIQRARGGVIVRRWMDWLSPVEAACDRALRMGELAVGGLPSERGGRGRAF